MDAIYLDSSVLVELSLGRRKEKTKYKVYYSRQETLYICYILRGESLRGYKRGENLWKQRSPKRVVKGEILRLPPLKLRLLDDSFVDVWIWVNLVFKHVKNFPKTLSRWCEENVVESDVSDKL